MVAITQISHWVRVSLNFGSEPEATSALMDGLYDNFRRRKQAQLYVSVRFGRRKVCLVRAGLLCCARMQRYATITVIGRDKTGVIARVTNFLFEQKANIEALEEAVTRGQFSMAIQASWRDGQLKPATLKRGLNALGKELGMEMRLRLTEPGRKQRMAIMVTREAACPEPRKKRCAFWKRTKLISWCSRGL